MTLEELETIAVNLGLTVRRCLLPDNMLCAFQVDLPQGPHLSIHPNGNAYEVLIGYSVTGWQNTVCLFPRISHDATKILLELVCYANKEMKEPI